MGDEQTFRPAHTHRLKKGNSRQRDHSGDGNEEKESRITRVDLKYAVKR